MPTSLNNQASITYNYVGAPAAETANSNITTTTLLDEYSLTAMKIPLSGSYRPGENITFTIRLENNGTGPLYDVTVMDNLGSATPTKPLTYIAGSSVLFVNSEMTPVSPAVMGGGLEFTLQEPLLPGDVAILVYVATVAEDIDFSVSYITNTADVTAVGGGVGGTLVTVQPSPSATVIRAQYAEVSIYKATDKQIVSSGENLTYTFTLTNTGNQPATDIVLTDTLPQGFEIVSVTVTVENDTTTYTPNEYEVDASNTITLPCCPDYAIAIPAATVYGPGIATIQITGVIAP